MNEGISLRPHESMESVMDVWPQIEGFILPALERDDWKMKPNQLLDKLADGEMGLYTAIDLKTGETFGALVAEVLEYPNASVFSLAYCGGRELHRWVHLIYDIEAEAARKGCHIVRIPGRKGWGHIFPSYKEVFRVFERTIQ